MEMRAWQKQTKMEEDGPFLRRRDEPRVDETQTPGNVLPPEMAKPTLSQNRPRSSEDGVQSDRFGTSLSFFFEIWVDFGFRNRWSQRDRMVLGKSIF